MRVKSFFLWMLLIVTTFLGGCAIKSVTTNSCLSDEKKDAFAEMIAEKVIKYQTQQN